MRDLRAATDRLADLLGSLSTADLTRPVPACPGWSVRDLVAHVGWVHQWAAHAVVAGGPEVRAEDLAANASPEQATDWYRRHAGRLVAVLDGRDAEEPAWSFSTSDQHVGFWQRRQRHEALLHTRDVLEALGRTDEWRLDPEVAWDGVAEIAEMFYPRQVSLGRTEPLPRPLRLTASDLRDARLLLGHDPTNDGQAPPVDLTAPAETLLLVLWHRVPCPDPAAAPLTAYAVTP